MLVWFSLLMPAQIIHIAFCFFKQQFKFSFHIFHIESSIQWPYFIRLSQTDIFQVLMLLACYFYLTQTLEIGPSAVLKH